MSVTALDPNPTIEIIIKGLTITHIQDGELSAQVGAILDTGCHDPKIKVIRITPEGESVVAKTSDFNLAEDIFLDVENTSMSTIQTLEKDEFNRADGSDANDDFRLVVDLERDIFPKANFSMDKSQIQPVFHIQGAVFYTKARTPTPMNIVNLKGEKIADLGGFAAEEIGAQIKLDQANSKAVLRSGDRVIRAIDADDVANGVTHIIVFDCDCPADEATTTGDASDFRLVYKAIGANLPEDQRVDLKGDPTSGGGVSPEVFCLGGNTKNSLR